MGTFVFPLWVVQLQAGQGGGQVGVDSVKAHRPPLVPWLPECSPLLLRLPSPLVVHPPVLVVGGCWWPGPLLPLFPHSRTFGGLLLGLWLS